MSSNGHHPKRVGKCKGENRDWHVNLQYIITSIKFSLDESYIFSVYDHINGDLKVDQLNIILLRIDKTY